MVSVLAFLGTPHRIDLELYAGDGGDGPTYSDKLEGLPARFEPQQKQLRLPDGRVVVQLGLVYMPAAPEPTVESLLWWKGTRYTIVSVQTAVWLNGDAMHHEVKVA